jgi:hypothetical protein
MVLVPGVITRRSKRLWIALLLPLLALRAMLPAGHMPVATDGELHIVMCSSGLAVQSGSGTGDRPALEDDSCLFAHAASFAPPSDVAPDRFVPPSLSLDIPVAALRQLSTSPYRFAAARGPPRYS